MTGMKQGAGDDPFGDEKTDTEPEKDINNGSLGDNLSSVDKGDDESDSDDSGGVEIPYKFRRSSVQDGRTRVPLFLQEETRSKEREIQNKLETRFDDKVSNTDLREALVLTGFKHIDDVQNQLEEWGYGMKFE